MTLTATTTQTTEVKLKPVLKAKLLKRLKTYAELRSQLKAIESAMDKEKGEIGQLREVQLVSILEQRPAHAFEGALGTLLNAAHPIHGGAGMPDDRLRTDRVGPRGDPRERGRSGDPA